MAWNKDNPCFGCMTHDGKKAPCCWVGLNLTDEEYARDFKGKPGVQLFTWYERRIDDDPGEQIRFTNGCPNLDKSTGRCFIEEHKPKNCSGFEPGNSSVCIWNSEISVVR